MKKVRKISAAPAAVLVSNDLERIRHIDVNIIKPNRLQPRREFETDSIIKLADSIRRYGILHPLSVRKVSPENGYCYELIAGERRLRAAKLLGLKSVPCLLCEVNEAMSAELALVENMLRENLGMFEQAAAFAKLSEKFGFTQEEIAAKMSLSQSAVANKMRLLRLSPEEQVLIREAGLTERHARAFLRISGKNARLAAIHYIIDHNLNVAETDQYISEILLHEPPTAKKLSQQNDSRSEKEILCANLDKYIEKLRANNEWFCVNKSSSDTETVIILTVKKDAM